MRVETLGEGQPVGAIIGAIHGDEPCGAHAVDRLINEAPAVQQPIKLIIANEEALEARVRFIDADLNRSFESSSPSTTHEHGLAKRLAEELEGLVAMAIHSTQSHPRPFGITNDLQGWAASILPHLSLDAVVEVEQPEGRMFASVTDLIELEAGHQGSQDASEAAYQLSMQFLAAIGALPDPPRRRGHPVFALGRAIEKPPADSYEVLVENFTRVEQGETFALADGEPLVADEPFYPVLLSACGYPDIFGYKSTYTGELPAEESDQRILD